MKRVFCLVVSVIFTMTTVGFSATKTKSQLQSELNKSNKNITSTKEQIKTTEKEQDALLDEIEKLNLEINTVSGELDELQGQIGTLNKQISDKQAEIEENEKKMEEENILLQKRMWAMYKSGGDVGYLKLLMNSESAVDFIKRCDLADSMIEADKELVTRLTSLSEKIEKEKSEIEEDKIVVEAAKKQEQTKKDKLTSSKSVKADKAKILESNVEALQKQLDREKAASDAIEKELQALSGSNVVYSTSGFIWPLPASSKKITCNYGPRIHPITKKSSYHTGVDIGNAPTGTSIYAVQSGKVIKTGWNTAYGNMIIIDHGNNVTTLYAHASKILVSTGQTVKKGAVIAKVGSTGYSTGPHLHFEVRINGKATNPRNYINY